MGSWGVGEHVRDSAVSELSGNLQDFPLPDVLRLLAKSRKQGVLHVYGDVNRGRVYLEDGRVSYATTRAGDDFADSDSSHGTGGAERRRVELGDIKDRDPGQFQDHLKAQIVEVLVRLGRETTGSFVFQNGVAPAEPVKEPMTVDELLADAEAELKEWNRIEAIIGSTATPMTMVRTMEADQTITIDGLAWNALAVMAGSATARDVAEHLGQFEIVAGRTLARLVEQGLVEKQEDHRAEERAPAPDPVGVELSELETKAVLSALSDEPEDGDDEPAPVDGADEGETDDGWGGLEDAEEPPVEIDVLGDDDHPPASELARRWRNLRSSPGN